MRPEFDFEDYGDEAYLHGSSKYVRISIQSILTLWLGDTVLSDVDRDNIRAFDFYLKGGLSRDAFDRMRKSFGHRMTIDSLKKITRRIDSLTGIIPRKYDCCVGTCVCYTGEFTELDECPYCHEPRRTEDGQARRLFVYIPLIPRLRALFQDPSMIEKLSYRANYETSDDSIGDIFDGARYQELLRTRVEVDGKKLPHCFFSDHRDVAFGFATDSFLLFNRRRGGPSATPLLVKLFNLDPSIRTHIEHVFCVGSIPGPKQPKHLPSFLVPFDEECAALAYGVPVFDASIGEVFDFHGYQLTKEGDIISIEKFLALMGHSSLCPCRSCKIRGCQMSFGSNRVYYVPLRQPSRANNAGLVALGPVWDSAALPRRTHQDFLDALEHISEAEQFGKAYKRTIQQHYGIKSMPALSRVNTLDFGRSIPWEWLHLFGANLVPHMISIWTGQYKNQDEGTGTYQFSQEEWAEIGAETAASISYIPSDFVRSMGNIAEDRTMYTAESYTFWFMYIAPHILKGRFRDVKYYLHYQDLVNIMKATLLYEISHDDITWKVEVPCREWVAKYEE